MNRHRHLPSVAAALLLLVGVAWAAPDTNAPLDPAMQQLLKQAAVESDVAADAGFDPLVAAVGEPVTYRVVITAEPEAVDLPDKIHSPPELELQKGGVGSSMVNQGQTSRYLATFNYRVVTRGTGSFTINAFTASVDGQFVTIPARTLTVVAPGSPAAQSPATLQIEVSEGDFYVGQAIAVNLVVLDYGDSSLFGLVEPKALGDAFLFDPVPGSQRRELREDQGRSVSALMAKVLAIPVHEGRLTLNAQTFMERRTPTDPQAILLHGYRPFLESAPMGITVRHLPEGALPGFTGLIGRFESALPAPATREVHAGDPLDLAVVVRGEGNLGRLLPPSLGPTPGWRMVPAAANGSTAASGGQNGSNTFHFTLIPLTPGMTPTPKIPFSYFDPQARRYVDLTVPATTILVLPPAGGGVLSRDTNGLGEMAGTGASRPAASLGSLARQPAHFATSLVPVQQRAAFWRWQFFLGMLLAVAYLVSRHRRFLAAHPQVAILARARRELRRQDRRRRRAAREQDAVAFAQAAVASLRVVCAPHLRANAPALVCEDVLRLFSAPEREGPTGNLVRQLFLFADEIAFKEKAPNPKTLWPLQPELEKLLADLRRRSC